MQATVQQGNWQKQWGVLVAEAWSDPELKEAVTEFRADEIAHRDEALAHGAEQAPAYRLLSDSIKAGCRLAIRLSKKI